MIPEKGKTVMKSGDMFKSIKNGIIFRVKSVDANTVILGTKDGTHSMFVKPDSMESIFVPFVEDEGKEKPKE